MKLLLVLTSLLAASQAQSLASQAQSAALEFCDASNTQNVVLDRFAEPATCDSMPMWQSPECSESKVQAFCSDDADVNLCRMDVSKVRCCDTLTTCVDQFANGLDCSSYSTFDDCPAVNEACDATLACFKDCRKTTVKGTDERRVCKRACRQAYSGDGTFKADCSDYRTERSQCKKCVRCTSATAFCVLPAATTTPKGDDVTQS